MSLHDLTLTLTYFAVNSFLFRGGISYGELFFDKENNIFFGPAINDAYLMETKAIMPRIIFSETLQNTFLIKKQPFWDEITMKDHYDNRLFFNYLYGIMEIDIGDLKMLCVFKNLHSVVNYILLMKSVKQLNSIHKK
jgi:hypothetical protein